MIESILNKVDSVMYYPILIIVMTIAGLYFTFRTKFVQIRLFPESVRLLLEPPEDKKTVSSLQAMLISTASRVGTGNIVGVSTAICLGGPGACFWMWIMCIVGASSAFIESTLAQVYKRKDSNGESYGGPAYYIEKALPDLPREEIPHAELKKRMDTLKFVIRTGEDTPYPNIILTAGCAFFG